MTLDHYCMTLSHSLFKETSHFQCWFNLTIFFPILRSVCLINAAYRLAFSAINETVLFLYKPFVIYGYIVGLRQLNIICYADFFKWHVLSCNICIQFYFVPFFLFFQLSINPLICRSNLHPSFLNRFSSLFLLMTHFLLSHNSCCPFLLLCNLPHFLLI